MGLEELKKHISDDMNKRLKRIQSETKKEIEKILNNAKLEVKDYEKLRLKNLEKEKKEMTLREDALIELEGNKLVQEARKKVIDSTFDDLKDKLLALKDSEKKKILKSLLNKAKNEIDVHTVYVNKNDLSLLENSKAENIIGGLIAENKEGTIRVDYSFDSMLEEFRKEILSDLSRELFKK